MASPDDSPYTEGSDLEAQETKEQDASSPLPPAYLVQSHISYPKNRLHEIAFVAILCSSQFMNQAALGQAIAPIHIIGDSFGTQNPGQLSSSSQEDWGIYTAIRKCSLLGSYGSRYGLFSPDSASIRRQYSLIAAEHSRGLAQHSCFRMR
jgi:hypothetical protein